MEDLHTRAQLIEYDPGRVAAAGVGTVLTREEVAEAVAQSEFPARLVLDLEREEAAHTTVAVDWEKDALEQLLLSTEDEAIALWFDEFELERAFEEAEVEGHGLRQRAAVLAVAVAATGATAAPSMARLDPGTGGSTDAVQAPAPAATSTGGGSWSPSAADVAGIAAGATLLISAAGFGIARKRSRPLRPA